jgi:hypothetical protein
MPLPVDLWLTLAMVPPALLLQHAHGKIGRALRQALARVATLEGRRAKIPTGSTDCVRSGRTAICGTWTCASMR